MRNINNDLHKLVYSIALKYKTNFVELEDLIQEGFLGLQKAYKYFDVSKGVAFTTYASYWIKKQILKYIEESKKHNYINIEDVEIEQLKYNERFETEDTDEVVVLGKNANLDRIEQKILELNFKEELTLKEIAEKLNLTTERVRQIKAKALRKIKINQKLTESLSKV
ncbi:MAG: sigma-70 family RNA polymerase sigma factor, partial [Elusimicrobiota bacterium]|nr:sigma-70 family RNA polymerase sigma factor [Endomicrobiia bacterium]MDW8166763.1 sigma-70 family RNA polymerase sigma factor [Elusimicrobiota bacterium]